MKNTRHNTSKSGFTIVEMIIVMVIIGVILSAVIAVGQGATDTGRQTSTVSTIKAIQTAAVNYYNANGGSYAATGTLGAAISMATLASNGFLPTKISGTNAWGGTITVAPDTTAAYFDITFTKVPSAAQGNLTTAVGNLVQTTPVYTSTSQSWQAAF
jgi:prepilin-type N-terminal cleavage/methylation domain-containing protein